MITLRHENGEWNSKMIGVGVKKEKDNENQAIIGKYDFNLPDSKVFHDTIL